MSTPPTSDEPLHPDPAAGPPRAGTGAGSGFFGAVRGSGLYRADDRWIGGVCAGLAHRLSLDPLLVRGLVAATVLLGGFGLVLYGVGWALLPEARDGRIHLQELLAGRFDMAFVGAAAFVVVGLGRGDAWIGPWQVPGVVQGLGWLALVGVLVALVVLAVQHSPGASAPPTRYGPFPDPRPGRPGAHDAVPPTAYGPFSPSTRPSESPVMSASSTAPPAPGWAGPPADATSAGSAPWQPPSPAPAAGWTPPPAPRPPRRRGPGSTTFGIVAALSLLTLAGLLLARRAGVFDGPVLVTAAGVAVVLAGLGVVVAGLRGRRSGGLGALAVLVLLISAPFSAHDGAWTVTGTRIVDARADQVVRITDVTTAEKGVRTGVGDTVVDLTGLDVSGRTVAVPVNVGTGDLEVRLPAGVGVDATVSVGAGSMSWDVTGASSSADGLGVERSFSTTGSGGTIRLDVSVGAGDVTIDQEGTR